MLVCLLLLWQLPINSVVIYDVWVCVVLLLTFCRYFVIDYCWCLCLCGWLGLVVFGCFTVCFGVLVFVLQVTSWFMVGLVCLLLDIVAYVGFGG